ncbi:MAG TPA: protein kinase [Verrucomicrobiae bacterium]
MDKVTGLCDDKAMQEQGASGIWPAGKVVGEACVIRELLWRNWASVTYRAFDQRAERDVAIKVLRGRWRKDADHQHRWVSFADDPRAMECLDAEIKSATGFDHPHLVRVFQVIHDSTTDGLPAVVSAYCAGGSLADRIYRGRALSLTEGLDAAIQVSWALRCLHDKQCTHCNLKTQNVLISPDGDGGLGRVLVSDKVLGWAYCGRGWQPERWPGDPAEAELLEHLVESKGAPSHMAPEFWGCFSTACPAIDAYAFGVLLYEIFCNRLPFAEATSLQALRQAHREAAVPDPQQWNAAIPAALAHLMQRCLAKDPSGRPAGFDEVGRELATIYESVAGCDHGTVRQRPATPEVDLEKRKHEAWQKILRGVAVSRGGEVETACRMIQEGEDVFRSLNDSEALQQALYRHSVALCEWGRLDEALSLAKEQEALCRQLNDRNALAGCLSVQGMILQSQGRLDEALDLLAAYEALCLELDDPTNLANCLFNQGGLLVKLSRLDEAAQKLGESVRVCRQIGRQDDLQGILHYYALILEFVGSHEEALLALQEEEAICRGLGDSEALSTCLEKQKTIRREMMGR